MHNLLAIDVVIETNFALRGELDAAVLEGEEGIVLATADILAWKHGCATLAEDNLTYGDILTMINLNTKVFWV